VAEVGNGPTLSLEKLLAAKPDLVFDFATGGGMDDYERIGAIGLSLMLTSEWQERSPLAKAEWIKLFGRLFGVEALADSIFEQSKTNYTSELRTQNSELPCPRVLAGMSYGGVWHAPGGNSFTARLIKDAGGCYLWAADTNQDLQFSLEEILQVADSADIWVNPGMFATVEDLIAAEPRVKFIKAFKEKRVFQNDGIKGPGGGNDFFESAVTYPAEMLTNLSQCIQNSTNGADSTQKGFDWYHNIFIF
jgi:iron complex transport system substrate-binding protein